MASKISELIGELQKSNLNAECPKCNEEYPLSQVIMFDGVSSKFPPVAEIRRQEYEVELKQNHKDAKNLKLKADKSSEQKSIDTNIGNNMEKFVPTYKNFNLNLKECRFLGNPIDYIIFEGALTYNINHITFLEVKTGKSPLNGNQKMVRKAVESYDVNCKVI